MDVDPIKATYFYSNETEKTKLNWFCYEYAYVIYSKIRESTALKKFCQQKGQRNITEFCVHFSKAMKQSIYDRLEGRTDAAIIDADYVQTFYPGNTVKETNRLVNAAAAAWEEHMDVCVSCPTRCISEKDEKCYLFDRLDKDERLY
jgi:hypothetical protein